MARYKIYKKGTTEAVDANARLDSNGNIVVCDSVEYTATRMDERFVSVSVKSAYPIPFEVGDWMLWRGEQFVIDDVSSVKKIARRGSYGEAFQYESMKFLSLGTKEIKGSEFLDVVLEDNHIHLTSLSSVSFYAETLDDLLDRIKANLDNHFSGWCIYSPSYSRTIQRCLPSGSSPAQRALVISTWLKTYGHDVNDYTSAIGVALPTNQAYTDEARYIEYGSDMEYGVLFKTKDSFISFTKSSGQLPYGFNMKTDLDDSYWESVWEVADVVNTGLWAAEPDYEVTKQNITLDKASCWDALLLVRDIFKERFIYQSRNIVVGGNDKVLRTVRYGKDNGLYEIERVQDSDQQVVATKLRAYGSQDNIPVRYYFNSQMSPFALVGQGNAGFDTDTITHEGLSVTFGYAKIVYVGGVASDCYYDLIAGRIHKTYPAGDDFDRDATDHIVMQAAHDLNLDYDEYMAYYKSINMANENYIGRSSVGEAVIESGYIVKIVDETLGSPVFIDEFVICLGGDPQLSEEYTYGQTTYNRLYITHGVNRMSQWPILQMEKAQNGGNLSDNMAVLNLMLPGFPNKSLYDWVIGNGGTAITDNRNTDAYGRATWSHDGTVWDAFFSKEKENPFIMPLTFDKEGIRNYAVYFDGSDKDLDDIKPSITDVTIGDLRSLIDVEDEWGLFNESTSGDSDWSDSMRIDELRSANNPYDDGVVYSNTSEGDVTKKIAPNDGAPSMDTMDKQMKIYLLPLGFDLKQAIEDGGGQGVIAFKDGLNGGREFEINDVVRTGTSNSRYYAIEINRKEDTSIERWFPYGGKITQGSTTTVYGYCLIGSAGGGEGDKFVLTGIAMPEMYITLSSVRLLAAALKWLSENDRRKWLYDVRIDEIYMQRDKDRYAAASNVLESLYNTIEVDSVWPVKDVDLGNVLARIETLSIKEYGENGGLPTYSVTMKSDSKVVQETEYPYIFNEIFDELFD